MLKEYQSEAVKWMIEREQDVDVKGGFLCDEVGLGKTIEILNLLNESPKKLNLLIVPKVLQIQWKEEAITWLKNHTIKIINKRNVIRNNNGNYLYIMSYSDFCYDDKILAHDINWGRIILDEGHNIKNRMSNTHKSVCNLMSDIKWCVSATPVMNNITDLYGLLKWFNFTKREVDNEKEKILQSLMMRRTKEDVKLNIPNLNVSNIPINMSEKEREVYETTSEKITSLLIASDSQNELHIFELLIRLVQTCIHPSICNKALNKKYKSQENEDYKVPTNKIEKLKDVLTNQTNNEKTLIFCKYKEEMKIYKNMFPESYHINGDYTEDERNEILRKFKTNNVKYLFIQINIGNCGLNIQSANHVVFTSPMWNPAVEHQAIGRCYRTGQTKNVNVYKLYYENTIEEKILKAQSKKLELIQEIWDYLKNKI